MQGIDTKTTAAKSISKPKAEKKTVKKSIAEPDYNVARKGITKQEYEQMLESARKYNISTKSKKDKSKRFLNNKKRT